jgi:flagellar basal-body rod modification protein FlgD
MAQFGTVSGIQELQKSFTDMATNLQSNQALMGSSLVGRTVEVPSEFGTFVPGSALRGAATLDGAASEVTLEVVDASGALVRRLSLGAQDSGEVPFAWDGIRDDGTTAAPGLYAIRALARIGNENVALETRVQARVDSVTLGGPAGMELNLAGMWPVAFRDVTKIL